LNIQELLDNLVAVASQIRWNDVVDIILVTLVFFVAFRFVRDRRAGRLLIGIAILVVLLILSMVLNMNALNYLLNTIFSVGLIAIIIVFQPELRSALEKMGDRSIRGIKSMSNESGADIERCITEVCVACDSFSKSKTGALIVFERNTKLGEYILTGTIVDASPSSMLFGNLFFNKSPLHDGAVIIRDGRIHAAGCFLPLSINPDITKELGTRHRAGIGISENSDAIVVIVSEETGTVSVAEDGKLMRDFDRVSLDNHLRTRLLQQKAGAKRSLFGKGGNDEK